MFNFTILISVFLSTNWFGGTPDISYSRQNERRIVAVSSHTSMSPYILSLEYDGKFTCAAAILDEWLAVTAAQCVDGLSPGLIRVRAGSSYKEAGGFLHPAEDILVHPDYDYYTLDYDMAIILVSVPFVFGENVQPIPIADLEPSPGAMALVSGWGKIEFSSPLQNVMVSIVDNDKCKEVYSELGTVTENMLCAEDKDGEDSCVGDAGAPLVVGEELVGLVSWGLCNEPGYPVVYSSLPGLVNRMQNVTWEYVI